MIGIRQYNAAQDRERWDELVAVAPQATFLHSRDYMDYHGERITDCSLMATDERGRLLAVLPASVHQGIVTSHGGLTYGGWLTDARHVTGNEMVDMMRALVRYCREAGYHRLHYKPVPYIYHRCPAQDDIYCLWRHGAVVSAMNLSAVIELDGAMQPPFNRGSRSSVTHAANCGVRTHVSDCWGEYWRLLSEVLDERYQASPVHSLDEITRLAAAFPDNIALHVATLDSVIVAGVVVYYTHTVAHCQYIAAGAAGRKLRALPLLMRDIMDSARARGCRYMDFGTSNQYGGRLLNSSLLEQKARMGGRGVVYPTYTISFD